MRKLAAALATFALVTCGLVSGAGPASATSHWTGKVHHVKPLADQWTAHRS